LLGEKGCQRGINKVKINQFRVFAKSLRIGLLNMPGGPCFRCPARFAEDNIQNQKRKTVQFSHMICSPCQTKFEVDRCNRPYQPDTNILYNLHEGRYKTKADGGEYTEEQIQWSEMLVQKFVNLNKKQTGKRKAKREAGDPFELAREAKREVQRAVNANKAEIQKQANMKQRKAMDMAKKRA
jgi:hypothetical protein